MRQGQDPLAPHSNPARVLLVHEQPLLRWALERLIESAGCEFAVVGSAADAGEALRLAREAHPDLVLLGLEMPGVAEEVLPGLVKLGRPRIIVLTASLDNAASDRAMIDGACGLLRSSDSPDTILKAMRKVHAGELWLDRAASGRVFGALTKSKASPDPIAARIGRLTVRERSIIAMLARLGGARHREIAGLLGVSEHTLRNHLSKIYAKLELGGHFELYLYAKRHGLDRAAS